MRAGPTRPEAWRWSAASHEAAAGEANRPTRITRRDEIRTVAGAEFMVAAPAARPERKRPVVARFHRVLCSARRPTPPRIFVALSPPLRPCPPRLTVPPAPAGKEPAWVRPPLPDATN